MVRDKMYNIWRKMKAWWCGFEDGRL